MGHHLEPGKLPRPPERECSQQDRVGRWGLRLCSPEPPSSPAVLSPTSSISTGLWYPSPLSPGTCSSSLTLLCYLGTWLPGKD